jgi:AcrR family transcriptional regulator
MAHRLRRHAERHRARRGDGNLLREEIMRATEKLMLKTNDVDSISIRSIANAVRVTPPSIYIHFSSKEDLILAVCERQFEVFDARLAEASDGVTDPVEALSAMGRAYVMFGLEHPEQYRFLFMSPKPQWAVRDVGAKDLSGFGRLVELVERCIAAGAFAPADAFTIACGLWTAVHGVTSLLIANPGFPWPPIDDLVEQGIDVHCRGLRTS